MLFFSFFALGCYKTHEQQYCDCLHIYFPPSRDSEDSSTASHVFIDLKKLNECGKFKDKSIFVENAGRRIELFFGENIDNLENEFDELMGPVERESYGPSYHPSRPIQKDKKAVHLHSNNSFSFYTDTAGNLISVNFWTSGIHAVDSLIISGKEIGFPATKKSFENILGRPDKVFKYYTQ